MLIISIIIILGLTIFNYYVSGKKLIYPPFIFCSIWFLVLLGRVVLTHFYLSELFPLHTDTYFLFIAGAVVSTVAGYISLLQYSYKGVSSSVKKQNPFLENEIIFSKLSYKVRIVLIGFSIVILPLFLKFLKEIVLKSEAENIFKSIRYETAVNNVGFGTLGYMITLSCFISLFNGYIFWQNKTRKNRILYILSFAISMTYAIATMGRTAVLMTICMNLGMYLISSNKISIMQLLRPFIAFIGLFLFIGILLDKGGSIDSSFEDNVDNSITGFTLYLLPPMNAIDNVIHAPLFEQENGKRTLRFFYVLSKYFGLNNVDLNKFGIVDEFIFVPYPVNVYTFYNPYIRDFGSLYALGWLFVLMLIHTNAFAKATILKKAFFSRVIFSFMFYPLIMVFFNDQYISILSTWIQLLLMVCLIQLFFWCKIKGLFYFFYPVRKVSSETAVDVAG